MSASTPSDRLREEGNTLYKAGKLEQAIAKYKLSAKRAPNSSAPLRNLSAAYYEKGKYRLCISTAEQALKLIEAVGGEDAGNYASVLKKRIEKAKECFLRPSAEEKIQGRIKIMKTTTRYRPSMISSFEHYTVGHDDMLEILDTIFEKMYPHDPQMSFLFAGIGDARSVRTRRE